jgi:hypothetical protein
LVLKCHPTELIRYLNGLDVATFKYPSTYGPRDCVYQEAEACIKRRKDRPDVIEAQMARYRAEGYPEHGGLVETSVVVRTFGETVRRFNAAWWREICSGSRRDQLSFNYVAWKLDLNYSLLPGSRVSNPFATWRPHREDIYGAGQCENQQAYL